MFKFDFFPQLFLARFITFSNPNFFNSFFLSKGALFCNFSVLPYKSFISIFTFFKSDLFAGNSSLFDFWAVDTSILCKYFTSNFSLYYMLFNINFFEFRIFLVSKISNVINNNCFTLTNSYWSANWLEREVFDLFGIKFIGHPDLRRLLTDYGFVGYPLKKDFPLSGYTQVRYDESLKVVISESVTFNQTYRNFNFFSPWKLIFFKLFGIIFF